MYPLLYDNFSISSVPRKIFF